LEPWILNLILTCKNVSFCQQERGFCKIHQAGAHSNPGNTLGVTSGETTRLVKRYLLSIVFLSVCLSSARNFSNILQADNSSTYNCHKLCKQSYLNVRVPHNTYEHIAILCTFRSFLLSSAAGRPS